MAVLTLASSSSPFPANFRTANQAPYAIGTRITVGSDISMSGGYEGVIFTSLTLNCSGNTATSSLYGNIWNNDGNSIAVTGAVSAPSDTVSPFTARIFNISDVYVGSGNQVFVGYSRFASSPTAWQVIEGDFSTRVSNYEGTGDAGPLLLSGTQTTNRRMVGTATYDLYDAGTISRSVTTVATNQPRVTLGGINGTLAKNMSINWGDGSANQVINNMAAGRNFNTSPQTVTKTAAYANPGAYTITVTISYSITSVGIPDIVFTNTYATLPGAPTSLSATAASSSQINLSWTAPAYVGTNGTVSYQLYRTPSGGSPTLVYNSTGTSFNDTGLSANTSYSYTVYATNNTGQGGVSNTASATTLSTIPGTPTSFSATAVSESQVDLSWSAPSSDGGSAITGYQIYRDATLISSPTGTSYSNTGLSPETSYTYTVYAVNANGSSISPATASATTQVGGKTIIFNGSVNVAVYPKIWNGSSWVTSSTKSWNGSAWVNPVFTPTAPQSFTATAASSTQINLSWALPSSIGGGNITSYTLKRGATTIYTGPNTSFNDTGLSFATNYSYTVLATNSIGNGPTASVSRTTLANVPSAPQSFTATATSSSAITLSWSAPSSNGGASISSYTVRRNGSIIYTTYPPNTSFSDSGLAGSTTYSYTVAANNSAGEGPTASASATTPSSASVPDAPTISSSGGGQEAVYDEYGEFIVGYITRHYISSPYTNNNGSPITSSTLVKTDGPYVSTSTQSYPNGESWEVTMPVDFENNDTSFFNVYHTNAIGNSAYSNTIGLST